VDREQSVRRISGRFGMGFRTKVIEMSGIGAVLHAGEMGVRLGRRILYAPDLDRPLGNPILHLNDMNPSLVTPLLPLGGWGSFLRTPTYRGRSVFAMLCG
jgi:hypothetical protein